VVTFHVITTKIWTRKTIALSQSKSSHRLTAMRSKLHRAAASHHASTKLGRDDHSIGVCCCSGQARRRYFQATTRKRRGRGGQTWRSGGDTRQTPSCGQARQVGRGAALALGQPGPVAGLRDRERISRARARVTCTCLRRDARRKPNPVCRGNLEMQDLDDGISQLSSASRASTSTRTPTSAKLDRAVSARRLSSTGSKPRSTHVCPPAADRDIQYNSTPGTYVSWRVHTDADSGWCAFVRDLCCAGMHPWPPPPSPAPIQTRSSPPYKHELNLLSLQRIELLKSALSFASLRSYCC
jgi:hypothetical protein